jgi:hypothetical protein
VKISDCLVAALLGLLLCAAPVAAEDHPDTMIFKRDAEWSQAIMKKHRLAYLRVGKTQDKFREATGGKLNVYWWGKTIALYDETLTELQRDVEATRKRFADRNPHCMKRLREFEAGLLGEAWGKLGEYRREMPFTDTVATMMIGVFSGFPNVGCATRHEKVDQAIRELKAVIPRNR